MHILGIDPGFAIIGVALLDPKKREIVVAGTIETPAGEVWGKRLEKIFREMNEMLEIYEEKVSAVAIERQFFNQNVTNALRVAEARGVVNLSLARFNFPIHEYTPLQIKQTLVGYGRATKSQIKEEVKRTFRLKEEISPDDASDAVAVALCHIFSHGIE